MALTLAAQARAHIERAGHILVVTREHPSVDALASLCAMSHLLERLGKTFELVVPMATLPTLPPFLTATHALRTTPSTHRGLKIRLDARQVPVADLSYDLVNGYLEILVNPKQGSWTTRDVRIEPGDEAIDLIIALDVPDRASCGTLSREDADLFQRIPTLNIDCDPQNEAWGSLNLVDVQAAATTEILTRLADGWEPVPVSIDGAFATALLTGIIARSRGFRSHRVSPKTLAVSASLVERGAAREAIVHGLWRTRTVQELKLWGHALARLDSDPSIGLFWTHVTPEDEIATDAGYSSPLDGIMEELIAYAPDAKLFLLCVQRGPDVHATLHAVAPYSAVDGVRAFQGTGSPERAECVLPNQQVTEATKRIAEHLTQQFRAA